MELTEDAYDKAAKAEADERNARIDPQIGGAINIYDLAPAPKTNDAKTEK